MSSAISYMQQTFSRCPLQYSKSKMPSFFLSSLSLKFRRL